MNRYANRLVIIVVSLVVMLGGVMIHGAIAYHDRLSVSDDAIADIVHLTSISQPAMGVSWYESRFIKAHNYAPNPAYPELDPVERSDFVYVK